ncbi:MAG: hypothetical protein M1817_003414 [Caeruleum heppii]|nr:MAG: hypothetical protein M1817_003414 [Caeruleum heppii]
MSWDQEQLYSFPHSSGQPPTPTATPTSANAHTFDFAPFQTPKAGSSHFDAQFPWGASPLQNHTGFDAHTPLSKRASQQWDGSALVAISPSPSDQRAALLELRSLGSPTSFYNQFSKSSTGSMPLAPCPNQLPLSPNLPRTDSTTLGKGKNVSRTPTKLGTGDNGHGGSVRSARSIQTPPPTSTGAGKRRRTETLTEGSDVPSTHSQRMASLLAHADHVVATHTSGDQPGPASTAVDIFGFPPTAPATVPAQRAADVFWDPRATLDYMDLDTVFSAASGAIVNVPPVHQKQDASWPGHTLHSSDASVVPSTRPHAGAFPPEQRTISSDRFVVNENRRPVTFRHALKTAQANDKRYQAGESQGVIDPSQLSSSPSRSSTADPHYGNGQQTRHLTDKGRRRPYQHQLEELQRERAMQLARQDRKRQRNAQDGLHLSKERPPPNRPGVKRNVTDSALLRTVTRSGVSGLSMRTDSTRSQMQYPSSLQAHSDGRMETTSSPVVSPSSCEVVFSIDAKGRARTDMNILEGRRNSRMGPDVGGTWDDSESSSSSDDDWNMTTSRNVSFTYHEPNDRPPVYVRRATKTNAKLLPNHSIGQFNQTPSRQDEDGDGNRQGATDAHDERGGAQYALRQMVSRKENRRGQSGIGNPHLFATSDKHGGHSGRLDESSSKIHGGVMNISPTTITDPDLATPSTERDSLSGGTTRCVCKAPESRGQVMVQCDSCDNWLHLQCVGLQADALPAIYVCIFCTGPTPVVRGGRVRAPVRSKVPHALSPLAHKSARKGLR